MSQDDLDKIREAGEKMGKLIANFEGLKTRVGRLEAALLAIIGAIIAAWAKDKGLF